MFAMTLTLIVLGALLYLLGTLGWFAIRVPDLLENGTVE
jgi:multisubunit Na+/H+ antiporter MnhG subunit